VFLVRYELDFYILSRRNLVFKVLGEIKGTCIIHALKSPHKFAYKINVEAP
jgi:hypothetical protein